MQAVVSMSRPWEFNHHPVLDDQAALSLKGSVSEISVEVLRCFFFLVCFFFPKSQVKIASLKKKKERKGRGLLVSTIKAGN